MNDDAKFRFVLHIIIPASCCIILGYISFGKIIFEPHITASQLITSGLTASIFLASLKITSLKNSSAVFFIMILLEVILLIKPSGFNYIFRDVVYFGAQFLSIYFFYSKIYLKKPSALYPLYSMLVFAVVFAVCITGFLAFKGLQAGGPVTAVFYYIPMQVLINSLIGLGIGAGTFFADKYLPLQKIAPEEANDEEDENADE